MDKTLFFVFGIALVVSAVGVALIGLKFENFPSNRGALLGVIMYFAALVGATAVFAVLNARDEQHAQEAEAAAETSTTTSPAPSGGPVQLAADPSTIAYTTNSLQANSRERDDRLQQSQPGDPARRLRPDHERPEPRAARSRSRARRPAWT